MEHTANSNGEIQRRFALIRKRLGLTKRIEELEEAKVQADKRIEELEEAKVQADKRIEELEEANVQADKGIQTDIGTDKGIQTEIGMDKGVQTEIGTDKGIQTEPEEMETSRLASYGSFSTESNFFEELKTPENTLVLRKPEQTLSERYNLFPIRDEVAYKYFCMQENTFWTAKEADYSRDKLDYSRLDPKRKRLIDLILGFFSPGDGLVAQNLITNFLLQAENFESQAFFIFQLAIELVHAEAYGVVVQTLIPDSEEQKAIFEMANSLECTKRKTDLMEEYMEKEYSMEERYVAFACSEGILFCTLFTVIFWFRSQGVMQNFIFLNEQIGKDESLHRDFGCEMYKRLSNRDNTLKIVQRFVEVEELFLKELVPEPIDDLNFEDLRAYLYRVANSLLLQLGHAAHWPEQPYPAWMNDISLEQKSNFYENRVGSYKRFNLQEALNWRKRVGATEGEAVDACKHPEEIEF